MYVIAQVALPKKELTVVPVFFSFFLLDRMRYPNGRRRGGEIGLWVVLKGGWAHSAREIGRENS